MGEETGLIAVIGVGACAVASLGLIVTVSLIRRLVVLRREQLAAARGDALAMLALLQDQITLAADDHGPGATQALADAMACHLVAARQAARLNDVYDWQRIRLVGGHGLDFLRPWRPGTPPAGQQLPATAEAGRITRRHQSTGEHQIVASPERTSTTPYHHPGGGIAGIPIPTGWYSQAWWAEALGDGQPTPQLVAGFQALFAPGTDASTYHSGFGDTRRPGDLAGIWIGAPPPPRPSGYIPAGYLRTSGWP